MGPWLCGGTRVPPAGRSTPATARATATRPTECQTESGKMEVKGEEPCPPRVTLNFDVIHGSLWHSKHVSEQHGKNKQCQVALMEPPHSGQIHRAESFWHENSWFSSPAVFHTLWLQTDTLDFVLPVFFLLKRQICMMDYCILWLRPVPWYFSVIHHLISCKGKYLSGFSSLSLLSTVFLVCLQLCKID